MTDGSPLQTSRSKPQVTVYINGEELFADIAEPGYLADFEVGDDTVRIALDYD